MERISIERHKTKNKVITLPGITKDIDNTRNQSKLKVRFTFDWMKKWPRFLSQSCHMSDVKPVLLFDMTHMKTTSSLILNPSWPHPCLQLEKVMHIPIVMV